MDRLYRYHGPFKQEFITLCSKHQKYDKDCHICNTGLWVEVYENKFDWLKSFFKK